MVANASKRSIGMANAKCRSMARETKSCMRMAKKAGRPAGMAGRTNSCVRMAKAKHRSSAKAKGVFLAMDAVVAMLLLFTVIIISFSYFAVPIKSNFESQLIRMQMQDAATVLSKADYLSEPLDSGNLAGSGIRGMLRATPDSTCMEVSAYGTKLPDGLVGYWKLDDTSDSPAIANFAEGGTLASRIVAYPSVDLQQFGIDENGVAGKAVSFKGAKDCFAIPFTHSDSATPLIKDDFTVSFWVKTTQAGSGGNQWFIGKGMVDGYGGGSNDFGISLLGNNAAFGFGAPPWKTITSAASINDGRWHHVVATAKRSDGKIALFVDGNPDSTGVADGYSLSAVQRLTVGCLQTQSPANYFAGSLDELRIYDRVLSSSEVRELYTNPTGAVYSISKPGCTRYQGAAIQSLAVPFVDSRQGENVHYLAIIKAWPKGAVSGAGGPPSSLGNLTNTSELEIPCGPTLICTRPDLCCDAPAATPVYACYDPTIKSCNASCGALCDVGQYCCPLTNPSTCVPNMDECKPVADAGCRELNESYTLTGNVESTGPTCFNVTADYVTLDCNNYAITGTNSTGSSGVYSNRQRTIIQNCNIAGFDYGVSFAGTTSGEIANSRILSATTAGIYFSSGSGNTISGTTVSTESATGINISSSSGNTIIDTTTISNSGTALYLRSSSGNTISNFNATSSLGTAFSLEVSSRNSLSNFIAISNAVSSSKSALYLGSNSNNNTISNFKTISSSGSALRASSSAYNTISNFNASSGSGTALDFTSSSINTLSNFNVSSGSGAAFSLSSSSTNTLSSFNASSNSGRVLYLSSSSNKNIMSDFNAISNSGSVFSLSSSSTNILSNFKASSGSGTVFNFASSSNNALSNFNATSDRGYVFYLGSSSNNTASNFNATSNLSETLFLISSPKNSFSNFTATSSAAYTLFLYTSHNNYFSNFNATLNKDIPNTGIPIYFYSSNNSVLSNFNVTSNSYNSCLFRLDSSSNSTISNFNAISEDYPNYALCISQSTNNRFSNFTTISYEFNAISLDSSSNNNAFSNFTASASTLSSVNLYSSSNNTFSDFNASSAFGYSFYLSSSSNNTLSRFNAITYWNDSLGLASSSNNTISNFTAFSYAYSAIAFASSSSNTISRGTLTSGNAQSTLLSIGSASQGNTFYWNNFTATSGKYVNDASGGNFYNTTIGGKGEGNIWYNVMNRSVNIIGENASGYIPAGFYIGTGGSGYPYNSTSSQGKVTGATDYAPLTATPACILFACGIISTPNKVCTLSQNIGPVGSTCFTIAAQNVTLDCNGRTITGTNSAGSSGVYSDRAATNVMNCGISGFEKGVMFDGVANGKIANVNASATYGIYLSSSSYNAITNVNASGANSIFLSLSSHNTIANSTATSQDGYGILFDSSSSNSLSNFKAVSGSNVPLYLSSSSGNTLSNFTATSTNSQALYLAPSSNSNIISNFTAASVNSNAIYLEESSFNTISRGTLISRDMQSALLYMDSAASYNTFYWNNFTAPGGISTQEVSNISFSSTGAWNNPSFAKDGNFATFASPAQNNANVSLFWNYTKPENTYTSRPQLKHGSMDYLAYLPSACLAQQPIQVKAWAYILNTSSAATIMRGADSFSYDPSVFNSPANANDGSYATSAGYTAYSSASMYWNYTNPSNSIPTQTVWQAKHGTAGTATNTTLPSQCAAQPAVRLKITSNNSFTTTPTPSTSAMKTSTWASAPGPNATWSTPKSAEKSDDAWATVVLPNATNITSNNLSGTSWGFSIPSTATITGIIVQVERKSSGTAPDITDKWVYLQSAGAAVGGNKASAAVYPTTDTVATYGSCADLWGKAGGWSPTEINKADFGILFAVNKSASASSRIAFIDQINITVCYTAQVVTSYSQSSKYCYDGSGWRSIGANSTAAGSFSASDIYEQNVYFNTSAITNEGASSGFMCYGSGAWQALGSVASSADYSAANIYESKLFVDIVTGNPYVQNYGTEDNYFSGWVGGRSEGNIWGNVMDGSVQISGTASSNYGPGLYIGNSGDWPYYDGTSQGKVVGVADEYPLTPSGT